MGSKHSSPYPSSPEPPARKSSLRSRLSLPCIKLRLGCRFFFPSKRSVPSHAASGLLDEKSGPGIKFERSSQDTNFTKSMIKVERFSHDTQATVTHDQQPLNYAPQRMDITGPVDETTRAYASFLKAFPEYHLTWILDTLRRSDFSRLDLTGETYVDYMGGAIYPESLVRVHTDFLNRSILGNTHSVSNR